MDNGIDFKKLEDLKAEKVEKNVPLSDVGEEILNPDKKRDDREKNQFHWVKIVFIWVLAICIIIIAIVLVLHLILPTERRWLSQDEVMTLKSIFVSGVGGAILGKFGNKLID